MHDLVVTRDEPEVFTVQEHSPMDRTPEELAEDNAS
jgi:hypothetical protein